MKIQHDIKRSELIELINDLCIKQRDRDILIRRLCDCICYEELAEEFNLSVQGVKKIVYKSQGKLFK